MYQKIFWCTNLCVRISARKSCSVQKLLCVTSSVCRNVSVQNASPQPKLKKNKQKNPRSNAWCRYRCWWWRWWAQGPTRRHFGCLKSIVESLRNNLLSSSDTFFDIFSDMLSGIRILSHIFSGILSGILSGISSGILCEWGPVGNTLIMNFNMFFLLLLLLPLLPVELFSQSVLIVLAENRQIDVLLKLSEHKTP